MDFFTNLSLFTLFALIGGVGFVFLLITLVLGDIFEMFGGTPDIGAGSGVDFGFLDSRVLAVFITAFGGFGAIGAQMGFGPLISSFFGLMGGVVFAAVVSVFGRFLVGQQASSTFTDDALVGRSAQVTVTIKPGEMGQISTRIGDERVDKIARSRDAAEEIKAGTTVTVAGIAGDSVLVEKERSGFV